MSVCEHLNFQASVGVNRLSAEEGGPITSYSADVRIHCAACGLPFTFRGFPLGLGINMPTVSVGGEEARLPIEPLTTTQLREAPSAGRA